MFEKIQKQLAEYFEIDPATITPETRIVEDLKADSLAVAELLLDLEAETGVALDDDVMRSVKTIDDLCKALEK